MFPRMKNVGYIDINFVSRVFAQINHKFSLEIDLVMAILAIFISENESTIFYNEGRFLMKKIDTSIFYSFTYGTVPE